MEGSPIGKSHKSLRYNVRGQGQLGHRSNWNSVLLTMTRRFFPVQFRSSWCRMLRITFPFRGVRRITITPMATNIFNGLIGGIAFISGSSGLLLLLFSCLRLKCRIILWESRSFFSSGFLSSFFYPCFSSSDSPFISKEEASASQQQNRSLSKRAKVKGTFFNSSGSNSFQNAVVGQIKDAFHSSSTPLIISFNHSLKVIE